MSSSSGVNHLSQPCIYGYMAPSNTERKSRLMKWLGRLFKGSGRGASNGRYPRLIGEENSIRRVPSRPVLRPRNSSVLHGGIQNEVPNLLREYVNGGSRKTIFYTDRVKEFICSTWAKEPTLVSG